MRVSFRENPFLRVGSKGQEEKDYWNGSNALFKNGVEKIQEWVQVNTFSIVNLDSYLRNFSADREGGAAVKRTKVSNET